MNVDISVVIPVYGCPEAIPELCNRLKSTLDKICNKYEIILVNDSCPKGSWSKISEVCENDNSIIGINLSRNFGQSSAILAGLDKSMGKFAVVMDCDLQDRPEDIELLYNKQKEGHDIVFANGPIAKKSIFSKIFYKIYQLATGRKTDGRKSNFCIINRTVIDAYCSMRETHRAFTMYLDWLGFNSTTIDVNREDRHSGKSSYTIKKRIKMATNILLSQSNLPIRMIFSLGIGISIISALLEILFAFILTKYIVTISIFMLISFSLGIILIAIGLIGFYIANTFTQTKNRPIYVISEIKKDNQINKN